jgi:hypothetical protein
MAAPAGRGEPAIRARGVLITAVAIATLAAAASTHVDAHKPITSPFTFTADVRPILQARCVICHAPGSVAPMSLQTHTDTVPWAESLRVELMAGHMPPWSVDRAPSQFSNAAGLSARELNVLLTWASGGTPPGNLATADTAPAQRAAGWPLGPPDVALALPAFEMPANEQEHVAEFVVPTGFTEDRWLRAADLLPGTAAIVRSASIAIHEGGSPRIERTLALWVPGDAPIATPAGAGLLVPAGAQLAVRVRYRKTWQYEHRPMRDRSSVGLYFASAGSASLRAIELSPAAPVTLARTSRALAIYAADTTADGDTGVVVTATLPTGHRRELIAFHPRPGWTRRFWYAQPVALPRGTTITVRSTGAAHLRLTLDVE